MLWSKKAYGCGNWESPVQHSKITVRKHHGLLQAYKELECSFKDILVDRGVWLLCFVSCNSLEQELFTRHLSLQLS